MHQAHRWTRLLLSSFFVFSSIAVVDLAQAQSLERVAVEGQPLAANIERVLRALESLGSPLPGDLAAALARAGAARDASALQRLLDPHVLLAVTINPEERVKVGRGPAAAVLQQGGYTPVAGQGHQRGRDHQAAADHQPAVRPRRRRRGRPEHEAAGPEVP